MKCRAMLNIIAGHLRRHHSRCGQYRSTGHDLAPALLFGRFPTALHASRNPLVRFCPGLLETRPIDCSRGCFRWVEGHYPSEHPEVVGEPGTT